jgi:hypothetical protein
MITAAAIILAAVPVTFRPAFTSGRAERAHRAERAVGWISGAAGPPGRISRAARLDKRDSRAVGRIRRTPGRRPDQGTAGCQAPA